MDCPGAPFTPGGPCIPRTPFLPIGPCGPTSPCLPGDPTGPVLPRGPGIPWGPLMSSFTSEAVLTGFGCESSMKRVFGVTNFPDLMREIRTHTVLIK